MDQGYFVDKESGGVVYGVYMPLTDTPMIGNFNDLPGCEEYMEGIKVDKIKTNLLSLLKEFEENDPSLLKLMDINKLEDLDELVYGMLSSILEFKHKARLQMKAKLLFEEELKDPDLTEEELIELLEFTPEVDKKKITIDKIIKYYPSLILNSIDKIKEYKNAKKEENRGSDSSCDSDK